MNGELERLGSNPYDPASDRDIGLGIDCGSALPAAAAFPSIGPWWMLIDAWLLLCAITQNSAYRAGCNYCFSEHFAIDHLRLHQNLTASIWRAELSAAAAAVTCH